MSHRRRTTTVLTSLLVTPLAGTLVACGSGEQSPVSAEPATESSANANTSSNSGGAGDVRALLAAASTALTAVEGTVVGIDGDAQGWEVTVVTADGTENDVEVSPDGATITRGPVVDDEDAKDRAEQQSLVDGASIDYAAAV